MNYADNHDVRGRLVLKGVPASPGIAMGVAFVLDPDLAVDTTEQVTTDSIVSELSRFKSALETVRDELDQAMELARQESATAVNIVESYQLVVADPLMHESIAKRIAEGITAEAGVAREFDVHWTILYNSKDAFLRSRAQDLQFVKERIIGVLRKRTLSHATDVECIVVAPHVTPQDMLFFKATKTLGYVTEVGGINSHVCILARDMGYPAVVGIKGAAALVNSNSFLIVDGYSGIVVVDPDQDTLRVYRDKASQAEQYRQQLSHLANRDAETTDGVRVSILANVDEPDHVDAALMVGADGVGLVRTEYLLMKLGRFPSVEEQTAWYRDIAERTFPATVTIRAFDVGSDKFRQGIPHGEDNPALGLRGIRFLLFRPDLFEQQILAILRASVHRNVRVMLPMISMQEEIEKARVIFDNCKQQLREQEIDFDEKIQVGIMIETPAAAMMADSFARYADFISIGTNDLAQYALATDRTNDLVADIYDPLHPAVIKLIAMIVDAADNHGRSVSVCGELAGHALATEMLIGLGIRELSVAPRLVLELKRRVLNVSFQQCVELVSRLTLCVTTQDVHAVLSTMQIRREKDDPVS